MPSVFAGPMDLLKAWELARSHDAEYLSSVYEMEAGETFRAQARSGLLPHFSAGASFTHSDSDRYDKYETRRYAVSLRQPLFNLESYYHYRKSGPQVMAVRVAGDMAAADLKLRVAESYFDLLASIDHMSLLLAEEAAVARQMEQFQAMEARGVSTRSDVLEARSRLLEVRAGIIEAKSNLQIKKDRLSRITGVPVEDVLPLGLHLAYDPPGLSLKDWQEKALAANLRVRYHEYYLQVYINGERQALSRHAPTVDAVLQHMDTNESTHYRAADDTITSAAVHLNIPLYSGGETSARHREAKAIVKKAQADLDHMKRDAVHRVTEAYTRIEGASARIYALEEAVDANILAVESSSQGVRAGIRTPTDVLDAERRLYNSRTRLLQARYDHVMARLSLLFHAGTLEDEDMEELNRLLAVSGNPAGG